MEESRVAVLLEELQSQFRTFGEGLELVNDKIDRVEGKVDRLDQKLDLHILENRRDADINRQEHQQLMQMINEVDRDVQTEIKRVK
jgi:hypothetical protein